MSEIDFNKTLRTVLVHIAHMLEAINIRKVKELSKLKFYSVHDCYLVTPFQCTLLIESLNKNLKNIPFNGRYVVDNEKYLKGEVD